MAQTRGPFPRDRKSAMKRHAWLVLSVAALFLVKAPLCTVACAEASSEPRVAQHAQNAHEAMPCHGASPAVPDEPSRADHECDCDLVRVAKPNNAPPTAASWAAPALVEFHFAQPSHQAVSWFFASRQHSIPPPDVLLLKSSLLI